MCTCIYKCIDEEGTNSREACVQTEQRDTQAVGADVAPRAVKIDFDNKERHAAEDVAVYEVPKYPSTSI